MGVQTKPHQRTDTPWLLIGSDLRATGSSTEWRRLNLPAGHERIDKLFPNSDVASCVLDVLASAAPLENVLVRQNQDGGKRYLIAEFRPLPSTGKPKRVLMQVSELDAELLLDAETGEVVASNAAAREKLGNMPGLLEPLRTAEARRAALAAVTNKGSHYLGRFPHRLPDGAVVELESLLVVVED